MGVTAITKSKLKRDIQNHQLFILGEQSKQKNIIMAKVPLRNINLMKYWEEWLVKVDTVNKTFLEIPNKYRVVEKQLCGSSGEVEIEFDHFEMFLSTEMEQRHQELKYFEEEQFWYLLHGLVSAAHELYTIGQKIGDVCPENIVVHENGSIKVLNNISFPEGLDGFSKMLFNKKLSYLSPEEIEDCKLTRAEASGNKLVSQSFSIGLTLLSLGLLEDVSTLYKINPYDFNLAELAKKIHQWEQLDFFSQSKDATIIYTPPLKDVIIRMLELDPNKRITTEEVYAWLVPFQQAIMNCQSFSIPLISKKDPPILDNNLKTEKLEVEKQKEKDLSYILLGSRKRKSHSINAKKEEIERYQKSFILDKNLPITPAYSQAESIYMKVNANKPLKEFVYESHFPISTTQYDFKSTAYDFKEADKQNEKVQNIQTKTFAVDDILSKIEAQLRKSKEEFPSK